MADQVIPDGIYAVMGPGGQLTMPDRSAGTADSTEEVIGTTVVPMPMPASASATVSSA